MKNGLNTPKIWPKRVILRIWENWPRSACSSQHGNLICEETMHHSSQNNAWLPCEINQNGKIGHGQPSWPQHSSSFCGTLFVCDVNSFLSFLYGGVMIQTHNNEASCWVEKKKIFFFNFRLNIPPFVSARTVLEVLESEDICENKIPVKEKATDTRVNEHTTQSIVLHIIRSSGRITYNGVFSHGGSRGWAETRIPGWKWKRRTCSGCATQYLWRWWTWVGSVSGSG